MDLEAQQKLALKRRELSDYIDSLPSKESVLIQVLHYAQHLFGYLSNDTMLFIGEKLKVPASKIFGVVSFYSFFTTVPKGECQIKLCLGTACFVRGADALARELESKLNLKMGQTAEDFKFSLESVRCVGACGLAPVVTANDKVYGRVTKKDISKIIDAHKS